MAEKKEKKIIDADTGLEVKAGSKKKPVSSTGAPMHEAAPVGNAKTLRIGAILLWVLALVFEVLAVLVVAGKVDLKFMSELAQLIVFLVLDLICVVIGSQLWKKANHIDPASEKNPTKFWLWNNMGVIVSTVAFIPFVIVLLSSKETDKKTKAIGTVVAIIALMLAGVSSYDFNPVSEEQQAAAIEAIAEAVDPDLTADEDPADPVESVVGQIMEKVELSAQPDPEEAGEAALSGILEPGSDADEDAPDLNALTEDAIRSAVSAIRPQLRNMDAKQRRRLVEDVAARFISAVRRNPGKGRSPYAALRHSAAQDATGKSLGQKIMAARNANLRSRPNL